MRKEEAYQETIRTLRNSNLIAISGLGLVVVVFASAFLYYIAASIPVTCADFKNRVDAFHSLPFHSELDADHDGIPCERLPI